MLLRQSSSAPPAGIRACLPASIHSRPGNSGRSRCSSEDENVASTPLQEAVFRPIGWSQCSHTTLPAFVLNVVVVRWSAWTIREIRQTGRSILSGQS
jgi:hypothetical protein